MRQNRSLLGVEPPLIECSNRVVVLTDFDWYVQEYAVNGNTSLHCQLDPQASRLRICIGVIWDAVSRQFLTNRVLVLPTNCNRFLIRQIFCCDLETFVPLMQ